MDTNEILKHLALGAACVAAAFGIITGAITVKYWKVIIAAEKRTIRIKRERMRGNQEPHPNAPAPSAMASARR